MEVRRLVPNIASSRFEESKKFYQDFLGLKLVMDMQWILTFASANNPTAQITIVQSDHIHESNSNITITIELSTLESIYEKALSNKYEITYPITDEPWGVRRFFVKDPNGVILNLMMHKKN